MNLYKQLNLLIEYIENHLEEKINYQKLAQILCCNIYILQRIFCLMTNITITEYIKRRRLSKSVTDLLNKEKIIDVALKYQYTSPTFFKRAFKKMYGINPSVLKHKQVDLIGYPVLSFQEQSITQKSIAYQIQKRKSFSLYSVKIDFPNENTNIYTERLWAKQKENHSIFTTEERRFGIVEYQGSNPCYYHIASE